MLLCCCLAFFALLDDNLRDLQLVNYSKEQGLFPLLECTYFGYLDTAEEQLDKLDRLQNIFIWFIFGLCHYAFTGIFIYSLFIECFASFLHTLRTFQFLCNTHCKDLKSSQNVKLKMWYDIISSSFFFKNNSRTGNIFCVAGNFTNTHWNRHKEQLDSEFVHHIKCYPMWDFNPQHLVKQEAAWRPLKPLDYTCSHLQNGFRYSL